jgi:ribosomal protein S18 acetylase RimI-like enzyme
VPSIGRDTTIRSANARDLTKLTIIEQECFRSNPAYANEILKKEDFAEVIGCAADLLLVAETNSCVEAYIMVRREASDPNTIQFRVDSIAVSLHARRRGLARALLRSAEDTVRRIRVKGNVRLRAFIHPTNDPSLLLFRNENYVSAEIVPQYYADRSDAIVVAKVVG